MIIEIALGIILGVIGLYILPYLLVFMVFYGMPITLIIGGLLFIVDGVTGGGILFIAVGALWLFAIRDL